MPPHTYVDREISVQQPTQLYKDFPPIHNIGHSKKKRLLLAWMLPPQEKETNNTSEKKTKKLGRRMNP